MNMEVRKETQEERKIQEGVTVTFSLGEISFGEKRRSFLKFTTFPSQDACNLYWDTFIYCSIKVVVNAYSDLYDLNVHPLVECFHEVFVDEGFIPSTDDEPSFLIPQPNDENSIHFNKIGEKVRRAVEKVKVILKEELTKYFNTEYTDRGVTPPQAIISVLYTYGFHHWDGELSGCLNFLVNPTPLLEFISNLPDNSLVSFKAFPSLPMKEVMLRYENLRV